MWAGPAVDVTLGSLLAQAACDSCLIQSFLHT